MNHCQTLAWCNPCALAEPEHLTTSYHVRAFHHAADIAKLARPPFSLGSRISNFAELLIRQRLINEQYTDCVLEEISESSRILCDVALRCPELCCVLLEVKDYPGLLTADRDHGDCNSGSVVHAVELAAVSTLENLLFGKAYDVCFQPDFSDDEEVDFALEARLCPISASVEPGHCRATLDTDVAAAAIGHLLGINSRR